MAVGERDPHSGHMTTGHEWNGIKELNTPVPRPVWIFLVLAALFAIGYWLLMPAWPLGSTYTKGLLDKTDERDVAERVEQAARSRSAWTGKIAAAGYPEIVADPELMGFVRQSGPRLFGDNCAACHGADAAGGKGFPNLTDGKWLWGGSPDAIEQTIRAGINSPEKDTRVSQMMAFGHDGILQPAEVTRVVHYVRSLSRPSAAGSPDAAGAAIFAANCASCHGPEGRGSQTVGAPDLTDSDWIYGGDFDSVFASVHGGRQGEMPAWRHRLSPVEQKILTLYILDRKAGGA